MNNKARETLCEIIRDYGREVAREPKKCKALLLDLCSEHRREINILVSAMDKRIANDLLTPQPNIPHAILLPQLAKQLHDNTGITTEFAQWAVESWALALGVIQEDDLAEVKKEREKQEREREERERKAQEERERKERKERERKEQEERKYAEHSQGFNDHPRDVQQEFFNILLHFYGSSSETTRDKRTLLLGYLNSLVARCNTLPLPTGTGSKGLEAIYIPNEQKDRSALSFFCENNGNKAPRLLLLGETGMGKSALVNYLAYCLAKANQEHEKSEEWLSRIPFWNYGALLPIRVVLHEFACFQSAQEAKKGNVKLLFSFLIDNDSNSAPIEQNTLELLNEHLLATANTHYFQAVLLFDGLEDVVHNNMLSRTIEMIRDTSETYPNALILVTCHTRYYNTYETCKSLVNQYAFRQCEIHPLNDKEIQQFVVDRHSNNKLWEAIKHHPELRKMAESPLLLTMMVIIYANGSDNILKTQAELYLRCIEQLLLKWQCKERCEQWKCETWQCSRGQPDVLQQLEIPNFGRHELMKLMAELGYEIHKVGNNDSLDRPTELSREIAEDTIKKALKKYIKGDNAEERCEEVARKIIAIACRNGLLLKNKVNEQSYYHFAYRSFQEFLAGYALMGRENAVQVWLEHTPDIYWHEVIKLMVSFLVNNQKEIERPSYLITELKEKSKQEQALAEELENFVCRDRVTEDSGPGLNEREEREPEEQDEKERNTQELENKSSEWCNNTRNKRSSWDFIIKWIPSMIVCVIFFVLLYFIM